MTASKLNGGSPSPNHSTLERHEEYQYLELIREIFESGEHRPDRYLISNSQPIHIQS